MTPTVPALLFVASLAAGCATVPAVSGPTVSVAEARAADPLEPVTVRWGGTIADVHNTAHGTTELEIVSRPLRSGGRPRDGDVTDGRFLAEVDTFLDPEIVVPGRDVTVTGRVTERREGRIGETPYRFPVVAVAEYRYWKPEPPPRHFPHPYPVGSTLGPPWYDDPWYGWPHVPRHHHRRGGYAVGSGRF